MWSVYEILALSENKGIQIYKPHCNVSPTTFRWTPKFNVWIYYSHMASTMLGYILKSHDNTNLKVGKLCREVTIQTRCRLPDLFLDTKELSDLNWTRLLIVYFLRNNWGNRSTFFDYFLYLKWSSMCVEACVKFSDKSEKMNKL